MTPMMTRAPTAISASEDSANSDSTTVDPVDDSDIPDEITSYITATKFITEDDIHDEENTSDLDAGFTYGKGAMGDGHIPETLSGFGDDSTILMGSFTKDPLESLESTTADSFETFTHLTGASHSAVGELGGLDLWPESSSSSSMHEAVDLDYEKTLGTQSDPLSGSQRPFDYTMQGMFRSMPVAEAGATSAASKSVHMVTHMATTTVHGTPVLQVVVSADNTIIPESLTISYPA
ncbi:hypothetical protein DL89DRAFT_83872 [Linderina pennispora]|uniref:Uncharacterized protein n=1 Tax=Linderina pennispora TaxID=61395 RepID=A0A1Y1WIC2_9FUNG|nr:uncharacterized protein DL89DRAFT_83872 [Linderina pennispora]ORX72864.1 hypothetical protein DL89DRAFT_83872 [Linderina pennispora]